MIDLHLFFSRIELERLARSATGGRLFVVADIEFEIVIVRDGGGGGLFAKCSWSARSRQCGG